MEYCVLGNTKIKVSKICFGSLTVGPLQSNLPIEPAGDIIAHAFKKGINFIDTAQLYGTYPHIKNAFKKFKEDIVISSKTYAYDKKGAFDAVEQARKETDRDIIDIFMLHEQESIHTIRGHQSALEELVRLKSLNIIKAVGISMHHISAVYGAIETDCIEVIHPLININGLGIADGTKSEMEEALMKAKSKNIGIFIMKPLGGGNLFLNAEDCFKYAFSLPYADSVAIGMQSIEEIDANISFLENGYFSDKEKDILNKKIRKLHIEDWCRGCGGCVVVCPNKALTVKGGRAVCDYSKCVFCGYCAAKCSMWAIKVV